MTNGVFYLKDDCIQLQEAAYIEHGCYIEIRGKEIKLFEIPYGGGEPQEVANFETLIEAINHIKTLT